MEEESIDTSNPDMAPIDGIEDLLDDEEMRKLQEDRAEELRAMLTENEWRRTNYVPTRDRENYKYETLDNESLIFDTARSNEFCIIHFFHPAFEMCKKMDSHLFKITESLAKIVKIVRISVENSPFLVQKFQMRVLPTLFLIKGGIIIKKMHGFEHVAQSENIITEDLLSWIIKSFESTGMDNLQSLINLSGGR